MRRRLDAELVRRGLVRSREQAVEAIGAGRVTVGGLVAGKAATLVEDCAPLAVVADSTGAGLPYVSRGAHKLAPAVSAWAKADPPLLIAGRRCLDAGASTGGFTDVLLRAGAAQVVAVDVGYGQLAWQLRTDPRVRVLDRCNARTLTPEAIGGAVDLVVADLSFISLRLVLPALAACTQETGDLVVLVKPQFEVGRQSVGRGGVVREPALRAKAIVAVAEAAAALGLGARDLRASALPGPAGNVEYLLWLTRDAPALRIEVVAASVSGTATDKGTRAVVAGDVEASPVGTQGSWPDAPAGPPREEA